MKPSFFRLHVLPVLFVFLIPAASTWFFRYAERVTDEEVLVSIEKDIQADRSASPDARQAMLAFFKATPVSRIMASDDPRHAELRAMFEPAKDRYAVFRWMQRIAWVCLATIVLTFVIVGVSVAMSFRSQAAQYWSLRIGWPVLRTSAVIQVIGQATLAAFLSFWVTAIFFGSYFVKLIVVIGLLAALAVFAIVTAMFRKVENFCEVEGRPLSESDAPALWQRIRELAARLNTAPPDRIFVGINPSFFVTENALQPVGAPPIPAGGRTLYLSLPMLKILSTSEADAVLGHELAHFSGQDTLWSRKIGPLMGRFQLYLGALGQGLAIAVGHFMLMFWKLYLLSIGKLSREREFRADSVGAQVTSPSAMQRALIKICGYCDYRGKTESSIIEKNRLTPELHLAETLENGYAGFLKAFTADDSAAFSEVPHPFDSHPPLNLRLESLGTRTADALRDEALHASVEGSWHAAIPAAAEMERGMWDEREKLIQNFHGQDLAWRLKPRGPEEQAIVEAQFPRRTFRNKEGQEATLEFDKLLINSWPAPILFSAIESASLDDEMLGAKRLTLVSRNPDGSKLKVKFHPMKFTGESGDLLTHFQHYYSRHKTAEIRSAEAAA